MTKEIKHPNITAFDLLAEAITKAGLTAQEAVKAMGQCVYALRPLTRQIHLMMIRQKEIKILKLKEMTMGLTYWEKRRLYANNITK